MKSPRYTLVDGRNDLARLDRTYVFSTDILGYEAEIVETHDGCKLDPDGMLTVWSGFVWDFGSGPAVDTPDVVIASLAHDALCRLTNRGLLPWSVRAEADAFFRYLLKINGCSWLRRWYAYLAVRAYSLTLAHGDRL